MFIRSGFWGELRGDSQEPNEECKRDPRSVYTESRTPPSGALQDNPFLSLHRWERRSTPCTKALPAPRQ